MPTGYKQPSPAPGLLNAAAAAGQAGTAAPTGTIIGWQSIPLTATPGVPASGQATASLTQPAEGQLFLVERVQVQTTSFNSTTASLQVGGYELDYTDSGNHDVAEEDPPIVVPSGAVFSVIWSNLNPTDQCTAVIQYRVVAQ